MNDTRIYKWDNLKLIMIWCVVIGHFLGEVAGGNTLGQTLYVFIYTFHMPVFVFLTGLYSKHTVENKRYEAVIEYLLVYLIMKLLDNLAGCLKTGTSLLEGRKSFHFFWSNGPEWYALAMAIFLIATMLIKDYNRKYMLLAAIFFGCLAGLDNHLGDHFASMRLCVFYPVFLAGYYTDPAALLSKKASGRQGSRSGAPAPKKISILLSLFFLLLCFLLCWKLNHGFTFLGKTYQPGFLYSLVNFLKGKCNYYHIGTIADPENPGSTVKVGIGLWGVALRLLCYLFWAILLKTIITISPNRRYFWSWLGQRTMSTFIWHKFVMVLLLYVLSGKAFLTEHMQHTLIPATVCIAIIVAVLTAYLPGFRIGKKLRAPIG